MLERFCFFENYQSHGELPLSDSMPTIEELLEGCKAFGIDFSEWSARRQFIATCVKRSGTFLDVGCGSGFLISCLANWTGKVLIPFGIDQDSQAVELARRQFPNHASNFEVGDYETFLICPPRHWPEFDSVFWNIPNSWKPHRCGAFARVLKSMTVAGGSLILAQYGTGQRLDESKMQALRWLDIARSGVEFEQIIWNNASAGQSIGILS